MTADRPGADRSGAAAATQLSDDFPVLLGPVRVETRFTATELLVRVFPDDWAVDAFEPRPTAAEVAALDAYWTALWRAGGDPVAEQAAWQARRRHLHTLPERARFRCSGVR